MKRIFKYPLKVDGVQAVAMPEGAIVLTVQTQGDTPCVWAEVHPDAKPIKRKFVTYGTGHPMTDGLAQHYVGTYQLGGGALVFHVFTDRVEYPLDS